MTPPMIYGLTGIALFCLSLYALIVEKHLLRKILAINLMGSGVFLVLTALARHHTPVPDPVPHAMIITGIVVAVSATALALVLLLKVHRATGTAELPENGGA
ncbi:MAG: NADH-quinone oxidoreductase subunit K [Campylobacterales bacterium]|jgi:multicomponent Na+:H+ antiporter subunit C